MSDKREPKQPRLLFVVESGTDVRLVEGFTRHFRVSILARRIGSGREVTYAPNSPVEIQLGPAGRFFFALLAARQLLNKQSTRYDVVIVQGYGLAALGCNLAGRVRGRISIWMLVCSPIEAYYRCRRSARSLPRYRRSELFVLHLVARINALLGRHYIVLSEYLESVVRGHGARGEIFRIPVYGVDTELFRPVTSTQKIQIRKESGLPESGEIIFFSSRVAPEKDVETLLHAFRILLDEGEDIWLLHRSGGFQQFLAAAETSGVKHRVIATDAVYPGARLVADYQACDLCVQASREEGLGFSVLEALACHTPVVAADVGGLKETIISGQTGWTYTVGRPDELKDCIKEALSHSEDAQARSRAGRALVLQKYDSARLFAEFADVVTKKTLPRSLVDHV